MKWNKFCMIWVIWELSDGFSREVWSSSLPPDQDLTGGGSPPPKIEKNNSVLKWFFGNFKCFKLLLKKKRKKINWNSVLNPSLSLFWVVGLNRTLPSMAPLCPMASPGIFPTFAPTLRLHCQIPILTHLNSTQLKQLYLTWVEVRHSSHCQPSTTNF